MNAEATTVGDLVRTDQLATIQRLTRQLGINEDEECRKVYQCRTMDLSTTGADEFISHLESLEQERKTA